MEKEKKHHPLGLNKSGVLVGDMLNMQHSENACLFNCALQNSLT